MHTADRMVKAADGWGTQTEAHKFGAMDEVTRDLITKHIVERTTGWALLFCQSEGAYYWKEAITKHGGKYRFTGVWVKPSSKPNLSGDAPGLGYESIVAGWCSPGKSKWNGGGKAAVWTANPEKRTIGNNHTSIKPQALMTQLVGLFSDPDQIIFDPFMGSGSTGVAAVSMGRYFVGIERDPEYFEICCRRMEEAQKGLFNEPYVKTKARVAVSLIEEPPKPEPKAAAPKAKKTASSAADANPPGLPQGQKLAAPKPRGAAPAAKKTEPKQAPKKRFSAPTIIGDDDEEEKVTKDRTPKAANLKRPFADMIDKAGEELIDFGPWDDTPGSGGAVGMDVECFHNFFFVGFKRFGNGQMLAMEMSERSEIDFDRLRRIIETECIITFNGMTYDMAMVALALAGKDTYALKVSSDMIIKEHLNYWQVEKKLDITLPRCNHVDLIEPNPAVRTGLKTLGARLNSKYLMPLPFHPDARLSRKDMNTTTVYCMLKDLNDTHILFNALREPLTLRVALGQQHKIDLRSKSDAQVGEAIIKITAQKLLKKKIHKLDSIPSSATYKIPPFISFQTDQMKEIAAKIEGSDFSVDGYGKVVMPPFMKDLQVKIGAMTYSMGIGGLHSTESNRAIHADDEHFILDVDVARQYPNIIRKIGMFPKAVGPVFRDIYGNIIDNGMAAKERLKTLSKSDPEYGPTQAESESCKIQGNGVFGKQGSPYSFLYAPNMMIGTTITGQLTILSLIERAEARGIAGISANTDGVVFYCRRDKREELDAIIAEWEDNLGFKVERTYYKSLYSSSVNVYIGVKEDGKFKLKGPHADPWSENSLREMMMKNPQMRILTKAVCAYITDKTPFMETIKAHTDPRLFITITRSNTGAKWRGEYIGETIRYYWSTDGDPFVSADKGRKIAKTDGARPLLIMEDTLPDDVDVDKYNSEAEKLAIDLAIMNPKGDMVL